MASERRAAAARLVEDHTVAHADAHRRNIEGARAAMAEAERCLFRADMAVGLAKVAVERQRREHQYPLPSFNASVQRAQERRTFISSLEEAERDRSQHTAEENCRCRRMVSGRLSDDGARPLMTHKYRRSQQSSREVLPKFIDSTQGEPKNICKP
jgi:hypothetical protein